MATKKKRKAKPAAAQRLIAMLREQRGRLVTVESATGGLLASELTDVPGASDVFWGSLVTYRDSAKSVLAQVPRAPLARAGAVSEAVAAAMARAGLRALRRSGERGARVFLAIAITGLAGPRGDGSGRAIGSGFVGIAISRAPAGAAARSTAGAIAVHAIAPAAARAGATAPGRARPAAPALRRRAEKRRFARIALRRALAALALVAASAGAGAGCATDSGGGTGSVYQHKLHRIALDTAHFRRPAVEGAVDSVDPDEEGYRRAVAPSSQLDCQALPDFFHSIDLTAVAECLRSLKAEGRASYRLELDVQPRLVLDETEKAPACLKAHLPEIPLPREIVFQNDEEPENRLSCFTARLDFSQDRVLGVRNPLKHTYVVIELPLTDPSEVGTPARTVNLLASWALTPFLGENREISAKIVPNSICRACFGKMPLLKPEDRPVYWPSPDGNP